MLPTRPVWAEISRSRLLANWKLLESQATDHAELLAVVKADAYGHGVIGCATVLADAGEEWFGVTSVAEAMTLRQACSRPRILVMSGLWEGEADAVIEHRLTPQIWEPFHFDLLEAAAKKRSLASRSLPVHLEIDSGMSRQGVRPLDALKMLLARCHAQSPLAIEGVMTHFAAPEVIDPDATHAQIDRFAAALDVIAEHGIRPTWIHAGNLATLFVPQHLAALQELARKHGARLMLRLGLSLYGYAPRFVPDPHDATSAALRPVLTWKTRIVSLRTIDTDETAGYNMTFRAARPTRLALIPVGYADGFNRLLSNRGHALVRGRKVRVAGRISMDQTILDITDLPAIEIGDEVVLIGEQGEERITAYDLADTMGTIPYEVTCAINARVPRLLVD